MKKLIFTMMILFLAFSGFAQTVAYVSYIDGDAQIVREGEFLDDWVDFGYEIENFDVITMTGGSMVITTEDYTGVNAEITVHDGASLALDIYRSSSEKKAGFDLLAGSIALKVEKLAHGSNLEVRTESAVMGVRGTEFIVGTQVGGELLVTCNEGRVQCDDTDKGGYVFAEPGKAVEKIPGERIRNIPVAVSDIATFRKNWNADRIDAFAGNAERALSAYINRYKTLKTRFDNAYNKLMSKADVLNLWTRQELEGRMSSTAAILKEKKDIISGLVGVRRVAIIFERIYYRLDEIGRLYENGTVDLSKRTADALALVRSQAGELNEKMSQFRFIAKMYAKRNGGNVPYDMEMEFEFDSDSDSFFD